MQENALPTSQMLTMEKYFIHSFYVMGKILSVISVSMNVLDCVIV